MASDSVVSGLRLVARPSARPDLLLALNAWIDAVRRSPGCINATIAEQVANPAILYAVVEWESEQALETFRVSQQAKDLARPLIAHLAEKVQTTRFRTDEVSAEELFSL